MPLLNERIAGVVAAARRDPACGVEFILGFESAAIHRDFQAFLTGHDDCYSELHRGIGKTTQLNARLAWEIGRDPAVRIKLVQQTDPEAAKSVAAIRSIIRSERFRLLFPGVVLDRSDRGTQSLSVVNPRKSESFDRDSTIEACGIFGRAGGRADILVADDVCDLRNSILQPALRSQVKDAWATNWLPMRDFARPRRPRTWKVGTPYHVDDITAEWRARHGGDGSLFRRPVVDFESPWPEVFAPDRLRAIRVEVGPIAFARAYELVPLASQMLVFQPAWIEDAFYLGDWPDAHRAGKFIGATDFAFTERTTVRKQDPDWSVFIVAWASSLGHLFLTDIVRVQESFPEFRRRVNELVRRRNVERIYAEANGPQKGLVQEMREGSACPVVGLARTTDKIVRASEQQAFVEQGRFHVPAVEGSGGIRRPRPDFEVLVSEMLSFPAASHDDCVDPCVDLMANCRQAGASELPVLTFNERPIQFYLTPVFDHRL